MKADTVIMVKRNIDSLTEAISVHTMKLMEFK